MVVGWWGVLSCGHTGRIYTDAGDEGYTSSSGPCGFTIEKGTWLWAPDLEPRATCHSTKTPGNGRNSSPLRRHQPDTLFFRPVGNFAIQKWNGRGWLSMALRLFGIHSIQPYERRRVHNSRERNEEMAKWGFTDFAIFTKQTTYAFYSISFTVSF